LSSILAAAWTIEEKPKASHLRRKLAVVRTGAVASMAILSSVTDT